MRLTGALLLALVFASMATAGEILLANGSRLEGELANEMLMISTGSGLLEVSPDQILALTRDEIRLKDGRVIRGTLVGGQLKTRTALGEIAIKADELKAFRATTSEPQAATGPPAPRPLRSTPGSAPRALPPDSSSPVEPPSTSLSDGLPALTLYQGTLSPPEPARPPASAGAPAAVEPSATHPVVGALPPSTSAPAPSIHGRSLVVVAGESALYRDAYATASRVGRVVRGQLVTYLDFIDRRLHILNALIFDGGHWIKVRVVDGTEGWVPADTVREVR